jgi:hypothetical protein
VSQLFSRVAEVEITPAVGGIAKTFSYPPFRIDFETEFDQFNSTKLRLYNPNQDTIDSVQPKVIGGNKRYPDIFVTAGYKDLSGVCCSGKIYKFKVNNQSTDLILELECTEQAGVWSNTSIYRSYSKMTAEVILRQILASTDIQVGRIQLGSNPTIKFASTTLQKSITDLCKLTESQFFFRDGELHIQPLDSSPTPSQILLDYSSGLIGKPEKIDSKKWKIQSLFRPEYRRNLVLYVKGGDLDSQIKIVKGKNKFSSHASASADFEGVEV